MVPWQEKMGGVPVQRKASSVMQDSNPIPTLHTKPSPSRNPHHHHLLLLPIHLSLISPISNTITNHSYKENPETQMKQSPNHYDGWSWKLDWEETQISKGITTTERKPSNTDTEEYGRSYSTSYYTDDSLALLKKDLMQNCDLPPPLKFFVGPEKPVMAPMKTVFDQEDERTRVGSLDQEKLELLLKALQLSQTRAREAERKVRLLTKERDHLTNALLQESLRLFAHQQWLKVLQFDLSKQKQELDSHCNYSGDNSKEEEERRESCTLTCCVAFALCLGIAFGCRYLFKGFTFPLQRGLVFGALAVTRNFT